MWWVQPFRKNWILSFKTAKMAFNSRKGTFLCFYNNTSFLLLPQCVVEGGLPDPKVPPLDPPLCKMLQYSLLVKKTSACYTAIWWNKIYNTRTSVSLSSSTATCKMIKVSQYFC